MTLPPWLEAVAADPDYDWAVLAWRRAEASPGTWFDEAKADAVVALWPQVFKLTVDRFAGVPFRLNAWEEMVVRLLAGWKTPVEIVDPLTGKPTVAHVRLFRRLLLWIARKNGKSEFLAALALLFWALDGVVGGEGYVFGRDEAQAKIVLNKMKTMIALQPDLASEMQTHAKSIYLKPLAARFELLSGSEEGKHGKNPSVIVGDEMHEWRSREIETTLRQGTGGRLQPIELYASTAGLKTNPTGVELWDESRAILDGTIEDAATLVVLFAAPPDADFRDEAVWPRANPSLGLSPTIDFLRREARLADNNPRAEAHFRRYHLNQWIDSAVRWLHMPAWDACAPDKAAWKTRVATLRGRRCWGACDVSSTRDVTAVYWLFEPLADETCWPVACRFWVPEDTLAERVKVDRVPYDRWVAAGAMSTTPGNFVDQNYVMAAILEGFEAFDVERVAYDPWNAVKLASDLMAAGVEPEQLLAVRQGVQSMGEPSKVFERRVYAGQLDHGGNPVLRWMAGNAAVRFDENMNYMPAKKRSSEKIDGIVAGVMAEAAAMAAAADETSVYEERGLVEVEI